MSFLRYSSVISMCLAACSSDGLTTPQVVETIPARLPDSVSLDQFLSIEANVECAVFFRCPVPNTFVARRIAMGSQQRCMANLDELPGVSQREQTRRRVAAGLTRFDGISARRCLEERRANLCAQVVAGSPCLSIYEGAMGSGASCRSPNDCANGTYCNFRTSSTFACPGMCTPRVALGERCSGDGNECVQSQEAPSLCQYDPALRSEPMPFRCVMAQRPPTSSEPPAQDGEICSDYRTGTRVTRLCASGLDCLPRTSTMGEYGVCGSAAALGERCVRFCQGDAVCDVDGSRFQQRCLSFALRTREGETCIQGNRGSEVCDVLGGLNCVSGQCRRVGDGQENSVCYRGRFGEDNCRAGLTCDGATQTCKPRRADGLPCTSGDDCASRQCVTRREGAGATAARCGIALGCEGLAE
jgi:hypothetical protein